MLRTFILLVMVVTARPPRISSRVVWPMCRAPTQLTRASLALRPNNVDRHDGSTKYTVVRSPSASGLVMPRPMQPTIPRIVGEHLPSEQWWIQV